MRKILYKQCMLGLSLLRSLENKSLLGIKIDGKAIDLGARNANGDYYNYIDLNKATVDYTDIIKNPKNVDLDFSRVIPMDFEKPLPLENEKYNYSLIFNVLEHIFNHQQLVNEIYRITSKNGKIIGTVPFLHKHHDDPNDFFRYTDTTLKRILDQAGFKEISVKKLCVGKFSCAAHLLSSSIKNRFIRYCFWKLSMALDQIFSNTLIKSGKCEYYGGLLFIAIKN